MWKTSIYSFFWCSASAQLILAAQFGSNSGEHSHAWWLLLRLHLVLPKISSPPVAPLLNISPLLFFPSSSPLPHAWFLHFCFQSPQVHPYRSRSRRKFSPLSKFVSLLMHLDNNSLCPELVAHQLFPLRRLEKSHWKMAENLFQFNRCHTTTTFSAWQPPCGNNYTDKDKDSCDNRAPWGGYPGTDYYIARHSAAPKTGKRDLCLPMS